MSTGVGKPGYCKICDSQAATFLNAKVAADPKGFNAAKAQEFVAGLGIGLTFNRQTWYEHVKHITHPLITHAKAAQESPVIQPKTNQGVLEMIRDIGMKRAIDHPDEVTVDHAIKAAGALEARKLGSDNVIILLAKFMAQQKPEELTGETIQGKWRELPSEEGTA